MVRLVLGWPVLISWMKPGLDYKDGMEFNWNSFFLKLLRASKELLQKHYSALSSKPFFNDLVAYMNSGPVVPMASEEHLKKHYADLAGKPFFPKLIKYMSSGPVVPMVWEGKNVVKTGRKMLGETNPFDSQPGTIRGDFCIEVGRNICHGSDSVESAEKEISLWFTKDEQITWTPCDEDWVYE
ncbi:hypothetical protein LSH36_40g21082 [Paralvinella palmiformis]|uniref:Nucleoside diphosphate kinase n=1 Tax=Paralvinella palmiformis TaxID=53620 RepID=A0AAD9NF70_9ANNE|nr:hypothetical protein LSH36_40g21082 [Paralvinella palmiformis]